MRVGNLVSIFIGALPVAVCWNTSPHVELVEAVQNTQRQTTHVKHGLTVHPSSPD